MTVTASIKFDQGSNHGVIGQALLGVVGTLGVASNGNNANVARWTWTMLDVPDGSGIPVGVISDGAVASASWVPDVAGSYFLQLDVQDLAGNVSTDKRVFGVPNVFGTLDPPFDAEAGALNFSNGARGWAATPMMDAWLGAGILLRSSGLWRPGPKSRVITLSDERITLNASPVTIFTKDLLDFFPGTPGEFTYPGVVRVDAIFNAESDDGTDAASFALAALFRFPTAGTCVEVGATSNLDPKATGGAGGWVGNVVTDGTIAIVSFNGDAGRNTLLSTIVQFSVRGT